MALGLFPRRIDIIILVWLAITFANELTIDASIIEKLFIADDSGFFAIGLLIYEHYRGRRDAALYSILALSVGTAVFQALYALERLGVHPGSSFDKRIVVAVCLASITAIFAATRVRRVPLPAGLVIALGGLTYPLYLLHMQIGYVIFTALAPARYVELFTAAIIFGAVILSWLTWRFVDRSVHRWTKNTITAYAAKIGWPSNLRTDHFVHHGRLAALDNPVQ
jgi:peptidoglycan/LPS O-acetylase OafA/YrhL